MYILTVHDPVVGSIFLHTLDRTEMVDWVNNAECMGCNYSLTYIEDPEWN